MSDLNQRLAEIRQMQGRDPLPSPHVIQGFDGGEPVMSRGLPDLPHDDFGLEMDAEEPPAPPPSPLIPRKAMAMPAVPAPTDMDFSDLTSEDLRQITEIMLKAKLRKLNAALAAVAAPRRLRGPNKPKDAPKATEAAGEAPAKRGRPKKVTA